MNWILDLQQVQPVAHAVLVLSAVTVLGLAIGHIRFRGIGLGISGVLLAGILLGHFGLNIAPETLSFIREFGLILFVFTIGMQVGPGFFSSLRANGLRLNLLAALVVFIGAGVTLALSFLLGIDMAAASACFPEPPPTRLRWARRSRRSRPCRISLLRDMIFPRWVTRRLILSEFWASSCRCCFCAPSFASIPTGRPGCFMTNPWWAMNRLPG